MSVSRRGFLGVVLSAAVSAREICRRVELHPLEHMRWLPLQAEFLRSLCRVKQIRCGNQTIGKTTPALADVVWRCLGEHPYLSSVAPPPITAWVVCASWSQSLEIQKKLWALLPKDQLAERTSFDEINGFSPTKSPAVVFKNGSIIRIKTTGQDALDFAGATIDVILFDEPPKKSRTFIEALQRVEDRGGVVLLSYTPINAPTDYLRELCESGQIEDHWRPLTPAELIPVGCAEPLRTKDGRPKDARWIEERRNAVPEHERDVVIDGAWETRAVGSYFDGAWNPHKLVCDADILPTDKLVLGIDHGDRPGKQAAVLMAVDDSVEPPSVHVVDLYRDEVGQASPLADAKGILAMLTRHGVPWSRLHFVGGDRVHLPGSGRQKSNRDLAAQLRRLVPHTGDSPDLVPPIRTVKRGEGRGAGSLSIGSRWLYHAMVAGRFTVAKRLAFAHEAIPKYNLKDDDHGFKDFCDAVRYGLDPWIFAWARNAPGPAIRLYGGR